MLADLRKIPLKYSLRVCVLPLAFVFLLPIFVEAEVRFAWDAPTSNVDNSPLTDFSNFVLSVQTVSNNSFSSTFNPTTSTYTLSNLPSGTYKANVKAKDIAGNLSQISNEIFFAVVDGGLDTDADGLNDDTESSLNTNPNQADSDLDGINDGEEVENGTNPLDRRSHFPIHEDKICAPWNGFLIDSSGRNMWNIFEQLNSGGNKLSVLTTIRDATGLNKESYGFDLDKGLQRDLLVHDFSSRQSNSYGNVCSSSSGKLGDLSGTMIYYKGSSVRNGFDFALAIPAVPPKSGTQFIPFNTFNPSSDVADQLITPGNWIQITNDNASNQTGLLTFWRADGIKLKEQMVNLAPNSRSDIGMHEVGKNVTGFAEWQPTDLTARFKIDSNRYYPDSSNKINSFESAAYLPSFIPTGEAIGTVFDNQKSSAILELSNTLDSSAIVNVQNFSLSGVKILDKTITLNPKSTFHLILEQFVPREKGLIVVKSNKTNSIFANLMQYNRDSKNKFNYVYAVPLVPPTGTRSFGSYNTFINHQNELLITNFSPSETSVVINMTRSTGEHGIVNRLENLPGFGSVSIQLNDFETADQYGIVEIVSNKNNSVSAWIVRERTDEYKLPLQLFQ